MSQRKRKIQVTASRVSAALVAETSTELQLERIAQRAAQQATEVTKSLTQLWEAHKTLQQRYTALQRTAANNKAEATGGRVLALVAGLLSAFTVLSHYI